MEQLGVDLEDTDRPNMRLAEGTGSVAEHLGKLPVAVGRSIWYASQWFILGTNAHMCY